MKANASLVVMVSALAAIAGCSTTPEDRRYPFSEGWRRGEVVKVLSGADVSNHKFWKCLRHTTAADRQPRTYAVLSYKAFNRKQQHLVGLSEGMSLRPGEAVWVDVDACEKAVAMRVD
jgi:hypothetical protein